MIMNRTPPIEQVLPGDDELMEMPISAGSVLIEGRIADEMTATLQGWLRGLPTRSTRHRKVKGRA